MRKNNIFMSAMCVVSFVGQSLASDNVYIDLSVLDAVPQDSIGFIQTEPLFPVIKKVEKTVAKSNKVKNKISVDKPIEKNKEDTVKDTVEDTVKEQQEKDKEVDLNQDKQPVVVDKPIPVLDNNSDKTLLDDVQDNKGLMENVADVDSATKETQEQLSQVDKSPLISTDVTDETPKDNSSLETNVVSKTENNQLLVPQSVISAKSADIIPENLDAIQPKEVYSLHFIDGSSELTEESIQTINQAIKDYDIDKKKKISIKAYNYDNGTESFQKKRISLMRATEVRSYFLNQGFKNFSIKVINNTTADEYKNTVQIEELD